MENMFLIFGLLGTLFSLSIAHGTIFHPSMKFCDIDEKLKMHTKLRMPLYLKLFPKVEAYVCGKSLIFVNAGGVGEQIEGGLLT